MHDHACCDWTRQAYTIVLLLFSVVLLRTLHLVLKHFLANKCKCIHALTEHDVWCLPQCATHTHTRARVHTLCTTEVTRIIFCAAHALTKHVVWCLRNVPLLTPHTHTHTHTHRGSQTASKTEGNRTGRLQAYHGALDVALIYFSFGQGHWQPYQMTRASAGVAMVW